MKSLATELKRRNVFKVGAVYLVVAWLLVQVIGEINEPLNLPDWFDTVVIVLLAVGFPITLIMAWVFDLTPEGVKATTDGEAATPAAPNQTLNYAILGFIALAVGFLVADRFLLAPAAGPVEVITAADTASRAVRRFEINIGPSQVLGFRDRIHANIALSPDGGQLVYVANIDGTPRLYLRNLNQVEAQALPGGDEAEEPFFSPDGEWVAFVRGSTLEKIPIRGGPPQLLAEEAVDAAGGTWAPDDSIIFTGPDEDDGWNFFRIPASGGTPEFLGLGDIPTEWTTVGWPYVLPGGTHLMTTMKTRGGFANSGRIVLRSLETGEISTLIEGGYNARYAPSGHIVFVRSASLWAVPFDLDRLEITGPEVPVINGVETSSGGGTTVYAFSSDGLLVYLPGLDTSANLGSRLVWVDRDGNQEPLEIEIRQYAQLRISPDGTRVALQSTDESGNSDIWIVDIDREVVTRLTFGEGFEASPIWTPDNERLVYAGQGEDGVSGIFIRNADGSGQEQLIIETDGRPGDLSPDGQQLIYDHWTEDVYKGHFVVPLDGSSEPQPLGLSESRVFGVSVSPDGRWIAYASNESGSNELYVRPFPDTETGKWQVSRDGGREAVWHPNRNEIYYRSGTSLLGLNYEDDPSFRPGRPRLLVEGQFVIPGRPSYDITPDGERFLMRRSSLEDLEEREQTTLIAVDNWFEELKRLAPPDPQ